MLPNRVDPTIFPELFSRLTKGSVTPLTCPSSAVLTYEAIEFLLVILSGDHCQIDGSRPVSQRASRWSFDIGSSVTILPLRVIGFTSITLSVAKSLAFKKARPSRRARTLDKIGTKRRNTSKTRAGADGAGVA